MKFIENKAWEVVQEPGIDGMYKAVMENAFVCYQTETTKYTPKKFVEDILVKNAHGRPLEFGTVYLAIPNTDETIRSRFRYGDTLWTRIRFNDTVFSEAVLCVTTNLRVLMQGDYETDEEAAKNGYDRNWLDDLKYWCEPTKYHYPRRTFAMYISRGCSDDNRTHITISSLCESTRFCNYSSGKFGEELTYIWPYWIDQSEMDRFNNQKGKLFDKFTDYRARGIGYDAENPDVTTLIKYAEAEDSYMSMTSKTVGLGLQPQQGKRLFPLGAKAELRLCGFDEAWQNFFWRRCDGHADPECVKVAELIKEQYNKTK